MAGFSTGNLPLAPFLDSTQQPSTAWRRWLLNIGKPSVNNVSNAYSFTAFDYTGLVTVRHDTTDGFAQTWTIAANVTVANVVGVLIPLRIPPSAQAITLIPAAGVTLYGAATNVTGPRNLAPGAMCWLGCEAVDVWVLSGDGWT